MKKKLVMLSALGAVSFGLTQTASAGWYGGDCDSYHGPGSGVCIEYYEGSNNTTWHLGGTESGSNKGAWALPAPAQTNDTYVSSGMDDFLFSGQTFLSCFSGAVVADCNLNLQGRVGKSGNDVRIDITNGYVTGSDALCDYIELDGFPWGIGPDTQHDVDWTGIPVGMDPPIIGSVGSIEFRVRNPIGIPPYLVQIADSHIHEVVFENNGNSASTFTFNNNIVENVTDNDTGCAVNGTLAIQGGMDVNMYFQ